VIFFLRKGGEDLFCIRDRTVLLKKKKKNRSKRSDDIFLEIALFCLNAANVKTSLKMFQEIW